MSLRTVQVIVGRLVTDEEYRLKFLSDPIRALTTLRDQGVELTSAEIDALIRTDRTLWSDAAARIDPDLQRSSWLSLYVRTSPQSRGVTGTRLTVGSIDRADAFHELSISLSFDEGRRNGQPGRAACA